MANEEAQKIKLTDQNMQTHKGFQWTLGEWRYAKGDISQSLCSDGYIHVYNHLLPALFFNPLHANFRDPRAFVCDVKGEFKYDNGVKLGVTECRLVQELIVPKITIEQRMAFGIYASLEVNQTAKFTKWADDWLSGKDRTAAAAKAGAVWAAEAGAVWAVWGGKAVVAETAWAAAWAAAEAAAEAAAKKELDFEVIAQKAMLIV